MMIFYRLGDTWRVLATQNLVYAHVGQCIGPFVARIAGVTFDPTPLKHMARAGDQMIELLPKVGIFNRLLGGSSPALGFPAVDPLRDALANIFAVQVNRQLAGSLQCQKSLDDRCQFHAVIGCLWFSAKQFPHMLTRSHQNAPTAWARIAFARAIGVDFNVVHSRSFFVHPDGASARWIDFGRW